MLCCSAATGCRRDTSHSHCSSSSLPCRSTRTAEVVVSVKLLPVVVLLLVDVELVVSLSNSLLNLGARQVKSLVVGRGAIGPTARITAARPPLAGHRMCGKVAQLTKVPYYCAAAQRPPACSFSATSGRTPFAAQPGVSARTVATRHRPTRFPCAFPLYCTTSTCWLAAAVKH